MLLGSVSDVDPLRNSATLQKKKKKKKNTHTRIRTQLKEQCLFVILYFLIQKNAPETEIFKNAS